MVTVLITGLVIVVLIILLVIREQKKKEGTNNTSSSLKYEGSIFLETKECTKASFLENSSLALHFWSNFTDWILSILPDVIPAFAGNIAYYTLKKDMNDSEIQKESGNKSPFSILEFFALIIYLILKQPKGEAGALLNNGYANIFYVTVGSRVVAVGVCWGGTRWDFRARPFGYGWDAGRRFFSRG